MAKKVEVSKEKAPSKAPPARREMVAHPLLTLREQMDRVFDEFMSDWRLPSLTKGMFEMEPLRMPVWTRGAVDVRFDVSESDNAIEISAELPGIDEEDVELTITDGALTLKGEKKAEKEVKEKDYYLSERRYGSFMRSLRVPETVDEDKITATFDKGVLKVVMPKRAEAKKAKKKIAIGKK